MGNYPQHDNSGSAFRNNRKREGKKDADFAGSATVGGVEYWVDMWTKPPVGEKKAFFSISFRPKQPRGQQWQRPQRPADRPQSRPLPAKPLPPGRKSQHDPDLDPIDPSTGEYKF